jgi:hypothetical protein
VDFSAILSSFDFCGTGDNHQLIGHGIVTLLVITVVLCWL